MPIIVVCPSCAGKLRVADELRGQLVRCPACGHTFDSTPPADPRPEPQDLPLQLTIDEPSSEPRPAPSNGTPGLVGALELKLSLDDEPSSGPREPAPPPAEPLPSSEPPRTEPPRLADEHDDLKSCPVCGKHVHRDSTRCYNCGERFDGRAPDRDVPSFRRRGPRRDAEPDRGAAVLSMGIISLACLVISCAPVGVILGLISWVMGQADLRKMKRGDMDANGQGMTQAGWICGILGTILNGLLTLGCLGFFGLIWYTENNRPVYTKPAAPIRAPVQQWPPPKPNPPLKKF